MKKILFPCFILLHLCVFAQTNSNVYNVFNRNDLQFESSVLMKQFFYSRPQRMAIVGKDMNENGAWSSVNESFDSLKTGKWFIEQQRSAAEAIIAGIVQNNEQTIERGLLALNWGAKQQQPDGSFNCPDNFHSSSFYVEAVAHSCISLKASKYYLKYKERIENLETVVARTVNWMLQPTILEQGKKRNAPYTHRRYLVAAAMGETGVLCNNPDFIAASALFVKDGLSLQDSMGFNPEKKGYDCSYHAVGLVFAHRYFDVVATDKQKEALNAMFEKAFKWLLSRIDENGVINGEGNTRTGFGQEMGRTGKPKGINYGAVTDALCWWGLYKKDLALQELANKVFITWKSNSTMIKPVEVNKKDN